MTTLASRLMFSDPRCGEMRYFKAGKAREISNHEKNVVVIESGEYGIYAHDKNVTHILAAAAKDEATSAIWLSIGPYPRPKSFHNAIPPHWQVRAESRDVIHMRIPELRANEFESFFAESAEYGAWNVTSPRKDYNCSEFIRSHEPGDFIATDLPAMA